MSKLPAPYYVDDYCTIYNSDCREILPLLPKVDLVLTDPPYGIAQHNNNLPGRTKFDPIEGDVSEMDLGFLLNYQSEIVSFGANCYPRQLPIRGRWICWDKRVNPKADAMLGSPFELAWANKTSGFDKIIRLMHGGVVNKDGREGKRFHPTQKPVALFRQILEWYPHCEVVADPFMGSGTTLVAAKALGRKAIGIEIERKYCDIAVKRLRQEVLDFGGQAA